jgi:hypothetical protein
MSLRKKPTSTARRIAASRANGQRSRGGGTAVLRERIRAAHRRYGFNLEAEELAFRALGEDPAEFQELLEGVWEAYNPSDAVQEGLVIRLARALWLMNRADRMQEGYAVRQAQEVNLGRQDRLHVEIMRLKMTAERLQRLARSVARRHYVTPLADLEAMKRLHSQGALKEMGEIALALRIQLQAPDTDDNGITEYEKAQRVVAQVQEIFGIGRTPLRRPAMPRCSPAGWRPGRAYPRLPAGHRRAGRMPALRTNRPALRTSMPRLRTKAWTPRPKTTAPTKTTKRSTRIPAGPKTKWYGSIPRSLRRDGKRGSGLASFWKTSSRGRRKSAKRNAGPS